jgi:hypothetical protein
MGFPGVSNYAVHFKTFIRRSFLTVFSSIFKGYLLALLLLVDHFPSHPVQFRKVNHPLAVGEGWDEPLPFLFVPVGVVDDGFELVLSHQDVHDGLKLFNLFLLVTDSVQQLLLLIFVLILQIPQLYQIGRVLLLDFLEAFPHLVDLLV